MNAIELATGTAVVLAQYPTPAGAAVDLADLGPDTHWRYTSRCTGCPHQDGYRSTDTAHRYAQAHAKRCYEQPASATVPAFAACPGGFVTDSLAHQTRNP